MSDRHRNRNHAQETDCRYLLPCTLPANGMHARWERRSDRHCPARIGPDTRGSLPAPLFMERRRVAPVLLWTPQVCKWAGSKGLAPFATWRGVVHL